VIWEAQFGDFVNGAQIIIDQFLVASEAKWKQTSSLVMLLPHGYEGQGPEHSSARPERFLQACGDLNIQVANLTTPAQLFHALRRQVVRKYQKPLIIFTPKSLLRHPKVISEANEFTMGGFSEVLAQEGDPKKTEKLVFCTGKIYYDLLAKQEELGEKGSKVCLVRVEQLYPYPKLATGELFSKFKAAKSVIWVQEEPINMGAWFYMRPRLEELCQSGQKLKYVGRKGSGTTAEGSNKAHLREQGRIVAEVFE
jgi:2-oxoglutarate dehydrogenase E1 component